MEMHAINLSPGALPRCFVIDEARKIVMECSVTPGAPRDVTFPSAEDARQLPLVLERAVEVLELNCVAEQTSSKTAIFGHLTVKVQLLSGTRANHTAVIIGLAKAA
ncbi:MAG TPA: hypothetical protein VNF68_08970 [Candidatus Baltobacteraceae bacterium]|nr:hypothetical protein [Candidatus Baltobacteraceae bacterium]